MRHGKLLVALICLLCPGVMSGQQYRSHDGVVVFYSHAAIEDITATSEKLSSGLNVATSDIAFSVDIKSFEFEKGLMQEHFNEKYMESDKYPTATFSGKVEGYDEKMIGTQQVKAKGNIKIHGHTMTVEVPGTMENLTDQIRLKTKFIVRLADFDITIPTLLWQNIAEQVEVRVDVTYLKK